MTDEPRDQLERLGLEEGEARVYLALLDLGTAKAREVADGAGLGRTTVYRLLENLADRGLVTVGSGSPMTFTPASPGELFDELRREKKGELQEVRQVEERIRGALEDRLDEHGREEPSGHRWRILRGRQRIVENAIESLEDAREEVRFLWSEPCDPGAKDSPVTHWLETLQERTPDLGARALANPDRVADRLEKELRAAEGVNFRPAREYTGTDMYLVGGEVYAGVVAAKTPEEAVAFWTDAPSFYVSHAHFFENLWAKARVQEG